MIIYKITNKFNGMVYIGRTKLTLEQRWKNHCATADLKHPENKGKLQYAISEFGPANFTVEQIDTAATLDEANEKEVFWIKHYDSVENGYNTSPGGRNSGAHKKIKCVETGKVYNSRVEAAKEIGVNSSSFYFVVDNPKYTCRGLHWVSVNKKFTK